MTRNPKLSIVTPSYNLGRFIERAIKSVLERQDYGNFEYWVIDGGSQDNTLNILKRYSRHSNFKKKFFWVSEPDNGQTDAINKGLERATGDWFTWLNADDYYEPHVFQRVAQTMKKYPQAGVIYGNNLTHEGKKIIKNIPPKKVNLKSFYHGNVIFGPASFFNMTALGKVGRFDTDLNYWMDYDMYMRLVKQLSFRYINLDIAHFTVRPQQKSTNKKMQPELHQEAYYVCRKNGGPLFSWLLINRLPEPLRTLVSQLIYLLK